MANQMGVFRQRFIALTCNPNSLFGTPSNLCQIKETPNRLNAKNAALCFSSAASADQPDELLSPKIISNIYNRQRSLYRNSVSEIRKHYFREIQLQRERDAKRAAIESAKQKREVLERRRLAAIKSARNAQLQVESREKRRIEWEKELEATQILRAEKKERYKRAKQMIIDELEKEAHLWLTNADEVEKVLGNPIASQILWARAGGMVGAPSGPDTAFGDDGDLWRYECHTWDARPTYKSPKEVMLEELEHMSYLQANTNEKYWTDERVEEAEQKEATARLRAIVREEGRRALLDKQRQLMRDVYGQGSKVEVIFGKKLPPASMPAPKLDYLADYEAQEREGVELLKQDPRKFFVFESDLPTATNPGTLYSKSNNKLDDDSSNVDMDEEEDAVNGKSSLGRPVALRNPFFNDKPTAFPVQLGRDLPEDSRTEKEKKRDERQERMRVAAEEAALAAKKGTSYEVAMAAEEDLEDGSEDVNYDAAERDAEKELWEDQMEEWGDIEKKVFEMTPPTHRVTEEELDWMTEILRGKAKVMQERIDSDERMRKKELESSGESSARNGEKLIESLDDLDIYVMQNMGYDTEAFESVVRELTPEQSEMLESIDFSDKDDITAEEMVMKLRDVPGLTEEQVQALAELEMSLIKNESLKNIVKSS